EPDLLCRTLQNSDAIERILDIHVLSFHDILNVERQIGFQRFLIIIHRGFFFVLALCDYSRFISNPRCFCSGLPKPDRLIRWRRVLITSLRFSTESMHFGLQFRDELSSLLRKDVEQSPKLTVLYAFGGAPKYVLPSPARLDEVVDH